MLKRKDQIALIYGGNDGGTRYFHPKIKGLEVQRSTMDLRSRFGERIWKLRRICNRIQSIMDGSVITFKIKNRWTCNRVQKHNGFAIAFKIYNGSAETTMGLQSHSKTKTDGSTIAFKIKMDLQLHSESIKGSAISFRKLPWFQNRIKKQQRIYDCISKLPWIYNGCGGEKILKRYGQ